MSVRIEERRRDRSARRLTQRQCEELAVELERQWPLIEYALTVYRSGYVDADYFVVLGRMDHRGVQGVERAETWEELARFREWQLVQRDKDDWFWLAELWADSACYSLRRMAKFARGEDPGPVVTQSKRRPDLRPEPLPAPVSDLPKRRPVGRPNLTLVRTAAGE